MQDPKVSILITVYNAENFIEDTINSLLKQTYQNFEIILVDNKSTDSTVNLINSFANNKIKLKCLKKNYGQTIALNAGLKLCKGEYIARIDADDVASPNRIETQLYYMEKNKLDFLSSQVKYIDEKGNVVGKSNFFKVNENNIFIILISNSISHPSVMIRKNYLIKRGGYNESYKYWQDLELWLKLYKNAKFEIHPEHLTFVRIHKNQVSKRNDFSFVNSRNNEWINLINGTLENKNLNIKIKVLLIIKRDLILFSKSYKIIELLQLIFYVVLNFKNIVFNKIFYLVFFTILKNRLKKL